MQVATLKDAANSAAKRTKALLADEEVQIPESIFRSLSTLFAQWSDVIGDVQLVHLFKRNIE
ncbi:hypothetical protein Fuma_05698 [Fuerstiella marisgermanici]|uniref:Uncharacterized protein n=1 Tax=Fuerstiella marisgermanici TaxID=1891926 RepID=A0A1P8WPS4_9PLAN|nr:hypothetical protein Fuma_05698 [Fuerstiella marisgermanici]